MEDQQPSWHELLGSNNWEGLLNPLHLTLRQLILRCGDFCQATYDAFNNDNNSRYAGSSRYGKKSFFHKVMLQPSPDDYQVNCFLYATAKISTHKAFFLHTLSRESWDRESNWIGYIATTTDEVSQKLGRREIYVAWRGTIRSLEWIDVFGAKSESAEPLLALKTWDKEEEDDDRVENEEKGSRKTKVMEGWLTIYISSDPKSPFTRLSARTQLLTSIRKLMNRYKDEKLSITLTGHSLGASISIISAFDLAESGITDIPISAFVFGSPRVGNNAFNDHLKRFKNVKILHIKNKIDVIPHYPIRLMGYVNTGEVLEIDTRKSKSLKDSKNPSDWHNLQGMLHVVAGWNGEDKEFELKVERDLALVNKSSGFLKEECLVPESWWVEKNRGMVVDENGRWVLAPPAEEDLPVPENYDSQDSELE